MLRVLFVCTGNRCRSPFAEASLAKLTEGLPVHVESAGTADLGPVPPTVDAIGVAESLGVDVTQHQARSLHLVDATDFDVVIGFERNHVATAVVEGGVAYERAFLLPEVVRLLEQQLPRDGADPVERARAALKEAHSFRGTGFVPGEEVTDPIGRPVERYEQVFNQISELNARVVAALFGVTDGRSDADEALQESSLWGPETAAESAAESQQEPAATGNGSGPSVAPVVASEQPPVEPADGEEVTSKEGPIPEATST